MHTQPDSLGQKFVNQGQGRRLADVVGARFEGQAPDGEGFFLQCATVVLADFPAEDALLSLVNPIDRIDKRAGEVETPRCVQEGADVLGEAAAAVAGARKEKLEADT